MTRHRNQADETLRYARKLATYVDDAIRAIDEGLAGWPTSTTGANPATDPTTIIDLDPEGHHNPTPPTDPCRADLENLHHSMRLAEHHTRRAAIIAMKYAVPRLDRTTITRRLQAADATAWCTTHLRHGMNEPRRENGTTCQYCADFRTTWNTDPPAKVLDFRARGVRLDAAKIARMIQETASEAAAARRAAKHARKATA